MTITYEVTRNPDFSGFLFYVEAGRRFDQDDYAAAYRLNSADLDPDDVRNVQDASTRLLDGEWLEVAHEK